MHSQQPIFLLQQVKPARTAHFEFIPGLPRGDEVWVGDRVREVGGVGRVDAAVKDGDMVH